MWKLLLVLCFALVSADYRGDVEREASRLANRNPGFNYEDFNDLETINEELDRVASKCIPGFICSLDNIGYSVQSRPIRRLKVTKEGANRKGVWLDATTHAREWLTTAILMKILKHFTDNYSQDKEVKHLLDNYDWHFVPLVNPDGYHFSWSSSDNRSWKKNRRQTILVKDCFGVDISRNADYAWGKTGSSNSECSPTYHGTSPASEPETRAIQDALRSSSLINFISLHSYGSSWLTPYGNLNPLTLQCYRNSAGAEMLRVAQKAAAAIENVFGASWERGQYCHTVGAPASGLLLDYSHSVAGIKYAAVLKVRGDRFVVPPTTIHPSFQEVWAGLAASMKAIEEKL